MLENEIISYIKAIAIILLSIGSLMMVSFVFAGIMYLVGIK